MPASPAHIPNSRERSILQALITNVADISYFAASSPQTVTRMIEKGWVKNDDGIMIATAEGRIALARPVA